MKRLKLFEEYINSPANKITTLLTNMINMFKDTFDGRNDVLSKDEVEILSLSEIEKSNTNDAVEKNLILNFSDNEWYYQVIFVLKIEDVEEDINKAYMKVKIYDTEEGKMLREWQSNLDIKISSNTEINEEGRFFVKVKEAKPEETQTGEPQEEPSQTQIQAQSQETSDTGYDYIENFIISKVSELKGNFEKQNNE